MNWQDLSLSDKAVEILMAICVFAVPMALMYLPEIAR
jgi:hypothetical protein